MDRCPRGGAWAGSIVRRLYSWPCGGPSVKVKPFCARRIDHACLQMFDCRSSSEVDIRDGTSKAKEAW